MKYGIWELPKVGILGPCKWGDIVSFPRGFVVHFQTGIKDSLPNEREWNTSIQFQVRKIIALPMEIWNWQKGEYRALPNRRDYEHFRTGEIMSTSEQERL